MHKTFRSHTEQLRARLGYWFLDMAEQLPRVARGPLANLQQIQAHRRKLSREYYEESKAPEGFKFRFDQISLIELFEQEQERDAYEGLRKLFVDERGRERLDDFFQKRETLIGSGAWSRLGIIVREKPKLCPFPYAVCEDLPGEISSIEITLRRILPSLTAVILQVQLADGVTNSLIDLQKSPVLPDVLFNSWMPFRRRGQGYRMTLPAGVATQRILHVRSELRYKVEKFVRRFLRGYFSGQTEEVSPRWPAIEICRISGMKDAKSNCAVEPNRTSWNEMPHRWLSSLALDIRGHLDVYGNESCALALKTSSLNDGEGLSHVLLVRDFANGGTTVSEYLLDSLALISVIDYLSSIEESVSELIRNVYRSLQRTGRRGLRRDIILNRNVLHASVIVDRMSLEFEQALYIIPGSFSELSQLKSLSPPAPSKPLLDILIAAIPRQLERIRKHGTLVSTTLSQHISLRNTDVMFTLQRRMFLLAIIGALLTLVSAAASWPTLTVLWQHVLHLVAKR